MRKTVGERFEYSPPLGWVESREGNRWLYRGPGGEELIVSGFFVASSTTAIPPDSIGDALLANGLKAAQHGVEHPDLRIIKPLGSEDGICTLPIWTVVAETADRDTLFCEAVVSQPGGVLLVTLEGPHDPGLIATFRSVLTTIRSVE